MFTEWRKQTKHSLTLRGKFPRSARSILNLKYKISNCVGIDFCVQSEVKLNHEKGKAHNLSNAGFC